MIAKADLLDVTFEFSGNMPLDPSLEVNGEKVDYCYPDQYPKYCLMEVSSSFRKMSFKVVSFHISADPVIRLFDDETLRLERDNEEVSSKPVGEECQNSTAYAVTIKE